MKITFQALTEATTPEMLAGFWDGIRPDPIEKEAANRLKRRVLGQTKETASPRVRFTRWGAVLAAACLVAVVGVTLRFAPGILKINQPIETEGAGEEINQTAETDAGIVKPIEAREKIIIMLKNPLQNSNYEVLPWDADLSPYLDNPNFEVISIPTHNDRGEQLIRFLYKDIVDSEGYPCQQLSDAFQKEYGIDPKTYLDFDIFVTETVPSLVGREILFVVDEQDPYRSYNRQLKEFLSEEEYDMVLAVNSDVRSKYFDFKDKYYAEYLAEINEKYLSNPDNIVFRRNGIFLYASEELIAEMETDEAVQEVVRYNEDTFMLIIPRPVPDC